MPLSHKRALHMLNNKTIETIMRLNQTEKINSSVRFIVGYIGLKFKKNKNDATFKRKIQFYDNCKQLFCSKLSYFSMTFPLLCQTWAQQKTHNKNQFASVRHSVNYALRTSNIWKGKTHAVTLAFVKQRLQTQKLWIWFHLRETFFVGLGFICVHSCIVQIV